MKIQNIWFDPPHVRWGRVVATAALVFAPLLGWMAHERGLWPGEDSADRTRVVLSPPSVAASSAPATRASFRPTGAAPSRQAAAPLASTSSARGSPGDVEVCGLGFVKATRDEKEADVLLQARRNSSPQAKARWNHALLASPDVRVRAAGLFTAGLAIDDDGAAQAAQSRAACADDKLCIDRLEQARSAAHEAASASPRDQLARLAAESRDPVAYALAMRRCAVGAATTAAGACQLLSLEQWATVDPDNALPWLMQADRLQAERSPRVDVAEAMFRVARSKQLKTYWAALLPLVMGAQPPGTPPLDRMLLAVDLVGLQAAWPMPQGGVPQFCSATALADANRRETCEAIADLFVNRSDALAYPMFALSLGQRLGWSAERVASLRDEIDAGLHFQAQRAQGSGELSCVGVEAVLNHYTDVARTGEREALRSAMRHAGMSVEETARRYREGKQAAQRTAIASAAPDTAASAQPK
jgi:hypothetical protein